MARSDGQTTNTSMKNKREGGKGSANAYQELSEFRQDGRAVAQPPSRRVVLIRDECWAGAATSTNSTGRIKAGESGRIGMSSFGEVVIFDRITPKSGYVFRIGESKERLLKEAGR